jgi:hypothetical protein
LYANPAPPSTAPAAPASAGKRIKERQDFPRKKFSLSIMSEELLYLIVVPDKKKDDGTLFPTEENADGKVSSEFP